MIIYRSISSHSDESLAREPEKNWYLLVNAPSRADLFENEEYKSESARLVWDRLAQFGVQPCILSQSLITFYELQERYHAVDGAIYGASSNMSRGSRVGDRELKAHN
ncbi:MAG: hypothetical protein J4G05_00290 [Chlorobi bacterium]|nr:hypothetical protein [Chlorobiota bacterium]